MREALRAGDVGTAAAVHRGPLLPRSEAPAVREDLASAVRRAVPDRGDVAALWAFGLVSDDVAVLERLVWLLPGTDPRREVATRRLGLAGPAGVAGSGPGHDRATGRSPERAPPRDRRPARARPRDPRRRVLGCPRGVLPTG
ncbi:hypothetical protein [Saccharothrix lopnurensis]|uniref:Uncharacterized protein n=1 Tax=Saccharothrix lopnurensis TaxID=1670621 RepID=A0ABW1P8Y9_9PSEU